jgi:hypothetical protein
VDLEGGIANTYHSRGDFLPPAGIEDSCQIERPLPERSIPAGREHSCRKGASLPERRIPAGKEDSCRRILTLIHAYKLNGIALTISYYTRSCWGNVDGGIMSTI